MKFKLILAEVPKNNVHPKQIGYGHFTESFDRIRLMPPLFKLSFAGNALQLDNDRRPTQRPPK